MSTLTSPETRPAADTRTPPRSYAGTGSLIRLTLRRERIPLLVWVVGIAAVATSTFSAFVSLYPAEAEREALAFSVTANPAFLALTGPVASTSIGGLTAWRIGVLGTTLIGLMAIVTVVRRTRADEESGRSDLLASSVVGRAAPLAAAVAVASGAGVAIGILVAAAGIANGQPVPGSIALGASLAGCGLVYAGVAAVAVQLVENARTATALVCHSLAARPGHRLGGRIHRLRRDHGHHRGKCGGSIGQQPAIAGRAGQVGRRGRVDRHVPGRHRQPRRAGRRRLRDLGCPPDELGGIGGSARPGAGRQRRPDQMDVGSPAVRAARAGAGAGRGRSGGRTHPRRTDRRRRWGPAIDLVRDAGSGTSNAGDGRHCGRAVRLSAPVDVRGLSSSSSTRLAWSGRRW